jgi:hypothetical protein
MVSEKREIQVMKWERRGGRRNSTSGTVLGDIDKMWRSGRLPVDVGSKTDGSALDEGCRSSVRRTMGAERRTKGKQ